MNVLNKKRHLFIFQVFNHDRFCLSWVESALAETIPVKNSSTTAGIVPEKKENCYGQCGNNLNLVFV